MMDDPRLDWIEQAIRELFERIERLESRARDHEASSSDERFTEPTLPAVPTVGPAADEATPTVPSAASVLAEHAAEQPVHPPVTPPPPPPPPPPPSPVPATLPTAGPPVRRVDAATRRDLEQVIGTRLAAIAGGLLVALAAVFFAKLAYDRGWIGAIPPIVRAVSLACVGGGLIVLAEFLSRRLGQAASIGLALAGLGTLYVDGWAIGSVLGLVGPTGAIIAMAATTLVGLVVTARFGSRLLGATSLVAGGLAPYLVGGEPSVLAPGLYFTALLVVAMAASIVRPRPFVTLRAATFLTVAACAAPWWLGTIHAGENVIVLLVSMAWWGIVHVTSLVAGGRGLDWRIGTALNLTATAIIAIPVPISVSALGGGPGLDALEGWTVLAFAFAAVAMAFQFGPGLDALAPAAPGLRRRERCQHRLAETAWLEGAVLLILAAALLLRGPSLPIAWVGLALGVVIFAARRGSRRAAIFAGAAAVLAQCAASFTFLRALGPATPTWLDGTPFRFDPHVEIWIVLATGAGTVATALLWPRSPSGRSPLGPAKVLSGGILPWLVPASFLGAPGWWTLFVAVPVMASVIVSRRRTDHAGWRVGAVWGWLAMVPMIAALSLPVIASLGGPQGAPDWAADVRVFMRDWGGPVMTILGLAATQVMFLVAISAFGRTARIGIDEIDARARASMRLLPVAAMPLGAAVSMVFLSATVKGWSAWVGPPMVGATGAVAILTALILLRAKGMLLASARWAGVLVTIAGTIWIGAAIVSAVIAAFASASVPLVNVRSGTGLVLLAMLAVLVRVMRALDRPNIWSIATVTCVVGLVLGSVVVQDLTGRGTFSADSGISIWWAVYAIGLILGGFRMNLGVLRKVGLGLLAVTAIKFLVIDLRNAETIHRIVSALGVGLLMVLTSVIYVRAFGTPSARAGEQEIR
jgi:uncharacterized membrane protein